MKKKSILIALACVVCLGAAAFFITGGGRSAGQDNPAIVNNDPAPDPNVSGIDGKTADPLPVTSVPPVSPVTPALQSGTADDDPVIAPGRTDTDVEVSLTDPVSKPAEADPDNHELVEGADPSEPPETQPPRQPVTTDPPKQTEPQGGDTNDKGQVWFPGFGWVTPGGPNQGEKTGSDGDINKQVGDMGN